LGDDTVFCGIPIHGQAVRGTKADLMLRPERIRLLLDGEPASPSLQATVSDITFLGNNVQVATRMGGDRTIAVRLPFGHDTISRLARGVRVNLSFDPAAAQVFAQR
jgi:putative spermidine/putrescine transport system ATP-binding protein